MKKHHFLTTCRKGCYETPLAKTVCVGQMMIVCASDGETQNYGSRSVWDDFENNE